MAAEGTRFAFNLTWYDQIADLYRPYQIFLYHFVNADMQVEMYDTRTKKIFLKKIAYPKLQLKDIYIGNIIDIFGRQMKIESYGDEYTKKSFEKTDVKTITYVGYDNLQNLGKIIIAAEKLQLQVTNLRMVVLSNEEITKLCCGRIDLISLCSKPIIVIELLGSACYEAWINNMSKYSANEVYTCKTISESYNDMSLLFKQRVGRSSALFDNCTCCVIKPHCFADQNIGNIIDCILSEGYEISCIELFRLNFVTAEEFYQVYKGVKPDFGRMVETITCGPCIAIEIRAENAVNSFRQSCGPNDNDIAKMLRPVTLRGKFGKDNLQNAVHCTDLPQDGILESDYFFNIMQYVQQPQ